MLGGTSPSPSAHSLEAGLLVSLVQDLILKLEDMSLF